VTMTLSDVINNAATAVVMAPIGIGMAKTLGVNPDAFLMGVAIAASCAFLTPIGHQNNTLVMGPGGYHFGDYWRLPPKVRLSGSAPVQGSACAPGEHSSALLDELGFAVSDLDVMRRDGVTSDCVAKNS